MPSIRKRGDAYQITVSVGYDVYGKKLVETTTYKPEATTPKKIEKEVDAFAKEFEKKVRDGQYLDGEKITFCDFMKVWSRDWLPQKTVRVQEDYLDQLERHVVPKIGHLKIAKIKASNVQSIITHMKEDGYSPKSVRFMFTAVNSVMSYAFRMEVIKENPLLRCDLPSVERDDKLHYFDLDQARRFLHALDMEYTTTHKSHTRELAKTGEQYDVPEYTETHKIPLQFKAYFYLAVYGGFRRGELIGLQWKDVNFDDRTISITKAVSRTKNGEIVKDTKTKASNREIILPASCFHVLDQWKREQKAIMLKLGSAWSGTRGKDFDENRVFIQDNGLPMNLDTPYNRFKQIVAIYNAQCEQEELKLPSIRLHDLRHTSATLLLSEGVDIETVSHRLGHSKPSVTLDVYGHALKAKDVTASDKLDKLFSIG